MSGQPTVQDRQLATLLQVCCDFAMGQIRQGERLVPFAGRVASAGDLDFVRFAESDTETPLDEVYARTQAAMRAEAGRGELMASAMVAAVAAAEGELADGFAHAVRVHLEMPGYSRVVLAPYRLEPGDSAEAGERVVPGKLIVEAEPAVIFAAQPQVTRLT